MGDTVLILAFVVIVIGGIGIVRGAFLAALLVGLIETLGAVADADLMSLFMARLAGAADRGGAGVDAGLHRRWRRSWRCGRAGCSRRGRA